MATPAAAGAATLVRQYFMDGFYPSGEIMRTCNLWQIMVKIMPQSDFFFDVLPQMWPLPCWGHIMRVN